MESRHKQNIILNFDKCSEENRDSSIKRKGKGIVLSVVVKMFKWRYDGNNDWATQKLKCAPSTGNSSYKVSEVDTTLTLSRVWKVIDGMWWAEEREAKNEWEMQILPPWWKLCRAWWLSGASCILSTGRDSSDITWVDMWRIGWKRPGVGTRREVSSLLFVLI